MTGEKSFNRTKVIHRTERTSLHCILGANCKEGKVSRGRKQESVDQQEQGRLSTQTHEFGWLAGTEKNRKTFVGAAVRQ